jgi:hypothetical protein
VQTHFISLCGDNGMSAVPAASVLSMMGAFDLVGTTLSGYLSDRYDNRKLLFWVLRAARPVAVLAAVHDLHAVRVVAVRAVLRPRLDRDRAADGEAGGNSSSARNAPVWSSAGSSPPTSSAPRSQPMAPA